MAKGLIGFKFTRENPENQSPALEPALALPNAAALVIGNEILSGRTQDVNVQTLARFLAPLGIDLAEVRFVPDVTAEIVAAVNALRARYTYLFTTGGIGPTHDDITADAIAAAFGVAIDYHPDALALLAARYRPEDFTEGRKRMARIPDGGTLIKNPVSVAPGFQIANVFVLAGVPKIMAAMLDDVRPRLRTATAKTARSLTVQLPEGAIALALGAIQTAHPETDIGSYPFFNRDGGGKPSTGTTLVVRGRSIAAVEEAISAVADMVRGFGAEPQYDAED